MTENDVGQVWNSALGKYEPCDRCVAHGRDDCYSHAGPDSPLKCHKCQQYRYRGAAVPEGEHEKHLEEKRREAERARRYGAMMDLANLSRAGMKGIGRGSKVPPRDRPIYDALAARFRAKDIHSFSFDGKVWEVWETEADWEATERHERFAVGVPARSPSTYTPDPDAAAAGHGPKVFDRAAALDYAGLGKPSARLSKAQLVAGLRKLADKLPPEALELLEAA